MLEYLNKNMKSCAVCQKSSIMGGRRKLLRGHYNLTTRLRKYANLQWARIADGPRVKICVRCLKTTKKTSRPTA